MITVKLKSLSFYVLFSLEIGDPRNSASSTDA